MATRMYYSEESRRRAYTERSVIAAICVAIGTVIALLFAPSDGESTRNELAEQADNARKTAENKLEQMVS